ncbi:rhomboid family intramembrane serine protease [Anaeromicropila herbilytica]|uniref:Peptidase S54 rhomboid domain-containing protein n=1 Tax=Anaeromicropila herbilytica TaxID=2785025 RepID=A0A7R7IEP8_9FIRM|nr:rhomboid family intramembrane serine protease [Anaeromicropila herbilytica]BCN32928.1 hypothetical protein bsdtb5_42230 [Anaeromicropila herbilytica]
MSPVIDKLQDNIIRQGFRQIKVNVEGIVLYSKIQDSTAYIAAIFDYTENMKLTKEQHNNVIRQIKEQFQSKQYSSIQYLNLICTNHVEDMKERVLESKEQQWIVDISSLRLIIYENQSSSYLYFKRDIELILDQARVNQSKQANGYDYSNKSSYESKNHKDSYQNTYHSTNQNLYEDIYNTGNQNFHEDINRTGNQNFHDNNYHNSNPNQYHNPFTAPYNNSYRRQKIMYFTLCNTIIVIINVLVYLWGQWKGYYYNENMLVTGAVSWRYAIERHEYYRIITYMFLHDGMAHIVNNMIVLLILGDNLERAVGKLKYVLIYFGTGVVAGFASMVYNMLAGYQYTISIGASGAIFGVVGAILYVVIANRGRLEEFNALQLIIFAGVTLYGGFTSQGTDNMAHVGGFISGIILAFLLYRRPNRGRMKQ